MEPRTRFNNNLTKICIGQSILFVLVIGLIAFFFISNSRLAYLSDQELFWITVSLVGFCGALLYFARKCYVYQINSKHDRIAESCTSEEILASKVQGYYLYLVSRPFAGIAVGPIAAMILLGGVSTISRQTTAGGVASLSEAGHYLIFLAAFIGGYTSSDLFDALSKFGKSMLRPSA